MIATARRRLALHVVPVVAAVCLVGCGGEASSPNQGGASDSNDPDSGSNAAFQAAHVIVVQIAVDTKQVSEIDPGVVNKGIVDNNAQLDTWYESGHTLLYLVSGGPVTLGDEVDKAETSVRHLRPFQTAKDRSKKLASWTAEQVARVILVQDLVDAKDIPRTSVQGMTDASGAIVAGPALDTWFTAHQGDQLPGGGTSTLASEVALIARPGGPLSTP